MSADTESSSARVTKHHRRPCPSFTGPGRSAAQAAHHGQVAGSPRRTRHTALGSPSNTTRIRSCARHTNTDNTAGGSPSTDNTAAVSGTRNTTSRCARTSTQTSTESAASGSTRSTARCCTCKTTRSGPQQPCHGMRGSCGYPPQTFRSAASEARQGQQVSGSSPGQTPVRREQACKRDTATEKSASGTSISDASAAVQAILTDAVDTGKNSCMTALPRLSLLM
mmetsp:Transcript_125296/g.227966  ORF Transcript_125296/g.227966 Transcript_125296/m.227966 type:complete len:224 (-) Transcript_125296:6-677(-)